MKGLQVALYARVSSEGQAKAHTIDSQVAGLLDRAQSDGFPIPQPYRFIDDGYSGSNLVRPALERLRDQAAAGNLERLYILAPDRLARNFAHQMMLVDELTQLGVEIVFLNQPQSHSPEDDLLLQVQGVIAEYERAKTLERIRRGKRHAARNGAVAVLARAPYGYHYVTKGQGGGKARMEVVPEQAAIVRNVFDWVGCGRLTLACVARQLAEAGIPSPQGNVHWNRSTILGMLNNPAYIGKAAYGRRRNGPLRLRVRAVLGHSEHPREPHGTYKMPEEEWFSIPVPALVSQEVFEMAQEQLKENRERARIRKLAARHLLQGLVVCKQCNHAYTWFSTHQRGPDKKGLRYAYFRCTGRSRYRYGGVKVAPACSNKQIDAESLEQAVWAEVKALLQDPGRLEAEYNRRLQGAKTIGEKELLPIERELRRTRNAIGRLIDSFADGLLEKSEFEPRVKAFRQGLANLEAQERQIRGESAAQEEIRFLVGQFQAFAEKVRAGLDSADFETKQGLIRTLVKRIEVDQNDINIVFRVNTRPPPACDPPDFLQHCRDRSRAPTTRIALLAALMGSRRAPQWD